jgi:hypothetical protein
MPPSWTIPLDDDDDKEKVATPTTDVPEGGSEAGEERPTSLSSFLPPRLLERLTPSSSPKKNEKGKKGRGSSMASKGGSVAASPSTPKATAAAAVASASPNLRRALDEARDDQASRLVERLLEAARCIDERCAAAYLEFVAVVGGEARPSLLLPHLGAWRLNDTTSVSRALSHAPPAPPIVSDELLHLHVVLDSVVSFARLRADGVLVSDSMVIDEDGAIVHHHRSLSRP